MPESCQEFAKELFRICKNSVNAAGLVYNNPVRIQESELRSQNKSPEFHWGDCNFGVAGRVEKLDRGKVVSGQ